MTEDLKRRWQLERWGWHSVDSGEHHHFRCSEAGVGRQYGSESKLECLASYHAFVSRLVRINRSRLNSWIFDVDMSPTKPFTTGIKSVCFRPSPTMAPQNPYGARSGTDSAVTDVPPGVLVLIIPTASILQEIGSLPVDSMESRLEAPSSAQFGSFSIIE
jgi:hypothetical protein